MAFGLAAAISPVEPRSAAVKGLAIDLVEVRQVSLAFWAGWADPAWSQLGHWAFSGAALEPGASLVSKHCQLGLSQSLFQPGSQWEQFVVVVQLLPGVVPGLVQVPVASFLALWPMV